MKRNILIGCVWVVLSGILGSNPGEAKIKDHPLISKYPGSSTVRGDTKEFDEYKLIIGIGAGKKPEFKSKALEGRVTRMFYRNPRNRSTLEVFRNYESSLKKAGLKTLFSCANKACGPAYAASSWNRFNGIRAKSGADARYLAGRISKKGQEVYVAVMVGRHRTQIDIVEVKAMETGLVKVDAKFLGEGLERDGHVSVQGIYFDTGKSILKPESKPALNEIAKLLKQRSSLRIFVVGHTDNAGRFGMNMRLSKDRAQAVVSALVQTYGVKASRLGAYGVGPLAPAATNAREEGRSQNRRVELVVQ